MKQIVLLYLVLLALGLLATVCCLATCSAAAAVTDVATQEIPAYEAFVSAASEVLAWLDGCDSRSAADSLCLLL
jgi:hypothetical protein